MFLCFITSLFGAGWPVLLILESLFKTGLLPTTFLTSLRLLIQRCIFCQILSIARNFSLADPCEVQCAWCTANPPQRGSFCVGFPNPSTIGPLSFPAKIPKTRLGCRNCRPGSFCACIQNWSQKQVKKNQECKTALTSQFNSLEKTEKVGENLKPSFKRLKKKMGKKLEGS